MDTGLARVTIKIFGLIAIAFLILGLLLTDIFWVAFDINHYKREYAKLGISESTGMNSEDLLNTTHELLDYIRGKREDLKISAVVHGQERLVFNQREIDHMVDVKDLFSLAFNLRWISFGIFALFFSILAKLKGKDAIRNLCITYLVVLAVLMVIAIVLIAFIFIDFTAVWDQFHYIFFDNDLWLLNPDTDIMIQMVPEMFFYDTVMRILGLFALKLIALAIYSGFILLRGTRFRRV